jgi:hypothetical protein
VDKWRLFFGGNQRVLAIGHALQVARDAIKKPITSFSFSCFGLAHVGVDMQTSSNMYRLEPYSVRRKNQALAQAPV